MVKRAISLCESAEAMLRPAREARGYGQEALGHKQLGPQSHWFTSWQTPTANEYG